MMTLAEVADALGFKNVKRVYALPIRSYALGEKGERGLRWDPQDVADFLEQRARPVSAGTEAA
jgi:hypothetical protein